MENTAYISDPQVPRYEQQDSPIEYSMMCCSKLESSGSEIFDKFSTENPQHQSFA